MTTPHQYSAGLLAGILLSLPLGAQAATARAAEAAPQQSAEAWARSFETALRSKRFDGFADFLDADAIVKTALNGITVKKESVLRDFERGMSSSLRAGNRHLLMQWSASEPTFKELLVRDGQPFARFRFCGEAGLSFIDLRLARKGDEWRVIDMINHSYGLGMVDQARSTAAVMLQGLDASVLERLFGTKGMSSKDVGLMGVMTKKLRQGDFVGVVSAYAKISEATRKLPVVTAMHLQALSMLEDKAKEYVEALESAAKRFPAPQFRLTLIDAHFFRENWPAGIACIDECLKTMGPDAVLLTLRSVMLQKNEQNERARADLKEALRLEPDCEYVVSTGLDVWLALEDWKSVAHALRKLEKTGKYDFKGVLTDEYWAGFRKAPESKPWRSK